MSSIIRTKPFISQEEQERRDRFKKMWIGLKTENIRLSEEQKKDRLAGCKKSQGNALKITILLTLMLRVRGLSLVTERVICSCPLCAHNHTKTVMIHSFGRYDKSDYWRTTKENFQKELIRDFHCAEFLK